MTAQRGRHGSSAISRAATSGFIWLFVQSFAARGAGFVSQLILARLLLPADWGTIALAQTVTQIANSLVSFGVDDVLLQRQKTIGSWLAPAFWISFSFGMIGMLAMFAIAPLAAHWYHSGDLVGLICLIAVATPLRTLATVPSVVIRSEMDFRFLAVYNTFEIVALQTLTIIFAWMNFGAYSFALPFPLLGFVKAIYFWRRSPPTIFRRFRRVQVHYILGSSSIVFASRTLVEILNQGDYIVLGLIASKTVVGLYFFAFRFSVQPVRMLAGNFNNVLFPALTTLRSEPLKQAQAALKASRLLAYLVMPFCFLQAAMAAPGLHLLFGERWMKAVPYVQILSIGLPFDAMSWISGALLSARREFWRAFYFAAVATPLFFGVALLGGKLGGALGVALAVALYYFIYPPVTSLLVFCRLGVGLSTVMEMYFMPSLLAGAAVLGGYLVSLLPYVRDYDLIRVILIGCVGLPFYWGLLVLFRPDIHAQLRDRMLNLFGRFARRREASA
ncbi:oligosaccharide flippase family protein [Acidomonas methanolica]|uniref:oligosaccharide flippase family protein n=1 Tax=Acidomonas methanolica TaxID=437 RepID=UPI00211A813A|nr:oligosaccharide flippase family protein [Acidomonas methanolica]MCQ9154263.1 oligosaccharide flippase family protein [Acidomonas methanolica]